MDKMIYQKRFQLFLKVLSICFFIMLIGMAISIIGLFVLMGFIGISSVETILNALDKGTISASIHLNGLELALSEQVTSALQYDKQLLLALLLLLLLYICIIFSITFFVWKLLKSMKEGQIFTPANSKRIEWISYGFILISLSIQTIHAFTYYTFDKLFQLNQFFHSSNWIASVSYEFFGIHWSLLFSGLIIWIIARIFKYGSFLQDEFDATL